MSPVKAIELQTQPPRRWWPEQRTRVRAAAEPVLKLLGYVRPHRRYAYFTVGFGTLGFLLSFAYPWIIGSAVDVVMAPAAAGISYASRRDHLVLLTQLAAAAAILHAVVVYGRGHCNVHLGDGVVTDLRQALFEHLQKLSLLFYAKERSGSILSRLLHDVHEASSVIYAGIIVGAMDAVQLLLAVVLLFGISPKLTLACLVVFPLYALVFKVMNPRVRAASERLHEHFSHISGNVAEMLSGQALIKTYAAEEREASRFRGDVWKHHELVVAQSHEGHLVASSGEVLVHVGTTIVVGYGGWLALQGELTAGMVTQFLGYVVLMYGPVRRFAELNITYQTSLSAMRRVFRVFDIEPAVTDRPNARDQPPSHGAVQFHDVRFRYANESAESRIRLEDDGRQSRLSLLDLQWVLKGVTLSADPGQKVAVVGRSGAGKTTLLSLLPRLYDVTQGSISIDGVDVRDYSLRALRSAIGIVQQDSFVFTGTIRENIAYGRPDASDEAITRAARAANAHEFIMQLRKGYSTRLGERGVNLSGGQRQRISIARALLKDPRILILDEATSSLDAESESAVQEALELLMRGRTCFIIAHRLSTIRYADLIVVLEDGAVSESGSHDQLMLRNGNYSQLVRQQAQLLGDEELRDLAGTSPGGSARSADGEVRAPG